MSAKGQLLAQAQVAHPELSKTKIKRMTIPQLQELLSGGKSEAHAATPAPAHQRLTSERCTDGDVFVPITGQAFWFKGQPVEDEHVCECGRVMRRLNVHGIGEEKVTVYIPEHNKPRDN